MSPGCKGRISSLHPLPCCCSGRGKWTSTPRPGLLTLCTVPLRRFPAGESGRAAHERVTGKVRVQRKQLESACGLKSRELQGLAEDWIAGMQKRDLMLEAHYNGTVLGLTRRCESQSGDFEKEVREPRAQGGPSLWHIPKRIAHCPDTARSIRATAFPPAHPVFHGAQLKQG